ncbi:MAG: hypothetical protein ACRECF_00725 [Methyloceanibacter sp.]
MRTTTWLNEVIQADPDHVKNSLITTHFEFSSPPGGNPMTHENGKRVFKANYKRHGVYDPAAQAQADVFAPDGGRVHAPTGDAVVIDET